MASRLGVLDSTASSRRQISLARRSPGHRRPDRRWPPGGPQRVDRTLGRVVRPPATGSAALAVPRSRGSREARSQRSGIMSIGSGSTPSLVRPRPRLRVSGGQGPGSEPAGGTRSSDSLSLVSVCRLRRCCGELAPRLRTTRCGTLTRLGARSADVRRRPGRGSTPRWLHRADDREAAAAALGVVVPSGSARRGGERRRAPRGLPRRSR
jgi:hypothetical protein